MAVAAGLRGGLDTPLGPFWVEVADGAVVESGWGTAEGTTPEDPVLRRALSELAAYFEGEAVSFSVPVRPGSTGLTARVLAALCDIPAAKPGPTAISRATSARRRRRSGGPAARTPCRS